MNHAKLLRWSLLGSLGLLPVGCGGASTGGETTGGETTDGEGPLGLATCTNPEVDATTGTTNCAEGYTFRETAMACTSRANDSPPNADVAPPACSTDCSEVPNGFCAPGAGFFSGPQCKSGCLNDSECPDGTLCACSELGGSCVPASCRTDADCQGLLHCLLEFGPCGEGTWKCQSPEDECVSSQECGGAPCFNFGPGHRTCVTGVACGRPFLVASQARVAPIIASSDWLLHAI